MTEMGIQMELKRRDSGLMHRAITRKPRVNIKSKPRKYSSRSSEDSHMEDSETEELGNINIDVCLSFEDVKYSHNRPAVTPSKKLKSRRKRDELIDSSPSNDSKCREPKAYREGVIEGNFIIDPVTPNKITQSRHGRPKIGLVRAVSVDNVLHRRRPTRDPSFFLNPKSPDGNIKHSDYDAGSQIMESYSEKLQYSTGTPRLSKGKRVRSFFRRLAGSLESLLRIKRKSESAFESQDFMSPSPPIQSRRSQDFHTPFAFPKERQSTEVTASFEATRSGYGRVSASVGATASKGTPQNISENDVTFHRGNRIYTARDTMVTSSVASALITPTPPRKPATKRNRGLRKNKFRRRHYIRREGSIEFSDISNDWETRSDTDSEGYAFQSNKLTMLSDSLQSHLDDKEQLDDESQNSSLDLCPQKERELTSAKEVATKRSIPVKLSEFRPPGNSIKHMRSKENKGKGPMKALRQTAEITMPRSESTGKFDTSKRQIKRKIRRRNSSFVPSEANPSQLRTDAILKEAISFEKIMSDINELADSLDKANISSSGKLTGEEKSRPNELTMSKAAKDATSQKHKSNQLSRNQSWVGKVSHRLDSLIEVKDAEVLQNAKTVRSKPPTSKTDHKRARGRHRKPSIIVKEKVSFDELESDFRKFARQVRERKISTEKVNTLGT